MNFQQLLTFSTVVAEGSMTAAAEKLYLTQPAVSQQIRNLEDELGVNLLVRGVRQAKPTVQGQLLFEYARKIIALTQTAQVAVQTLGEGIRGSLRVGTLNSLGLYLLSPLVGGFLRYNPHVTMQLSYAEGEDVLRSLEQGDLDIAILPDIQQEYGRNPGQLEVRPLLKDEVWLLASSRTLGAPSSVRLLDLADKPIAVMRGEYPAFERQLASAIQEAGIAWRPVFESNNVGTLKKVIESGLGWGFLPAHCVRKQVRAGRLSVIELPAELRHATTINYYCRRSDTAGAALDVFYNALKPNPVPG